MTEEPSIFSSSQDLVSAAAAVTKETCPLIGIKSLGVDYGLVRTGLAVTVGYAPQPLEIVEESNATVVARHIVQHADSLRVSQIILGLPLHKNGTEAEQTNLTRTFGSQLALQVLQKLGPNVPVLLWDERYTSKEAAARLRTRQSMTRQSLYGTLDAEAACIILETYYNDHGKGAEPIVVRDPQLREQCLEQYQERMRQVREERKAVLDQRESNMNKRQDAMERARRLEEQMRANGTLGVSNKKKRKAKRPANKKEKENWIVP
jgi:putative Holliday junction resolvase